jgi:hypothetical protein
LYVIGFPPAKVATLFDPTGRPTIASTEPMAVAQSLSSLTWIAPGESRRNFMLQVLHKGLSSSPFRWVRFFSLAALKADLYWPAAFFPYKLLE